MGRLMQWPIIEEKESSSLPSNEGNSKAKTRWKDRMMTTITEKLAYNPSPFCIQASESSCTIHAGNRRRRPQSVAPSHQVSAADSNDWHVIDDSISLPKSSFMPSWNVVWTTTSLAVRTILRAKQQLTQHQTPSIESTTRGTAAISTTNRSPRRLRNRRNISTFLILVASVGLVASHWLLHSWNLAEMSTIEDASWLTIMPDNIWTRAAKNDDPTLATTSTVASTGLSVWNAAMRTLGVDALLNNDKTIDNSSIHRTCYSPEANVSFPYRVTTTSTAAITANTSSALWGSKQPDSGSRRNHILSKIEDEPRVGYSRVSDTTCGMNARNPLIRYLTESILPPIQALKEQECHEMLVFSVAFDSYNHAKKPKRLSRYSPPNVNGTCTLLFVLQDDLAFTGSASTLEVVPGSQGALYRSTKDFTALRVPIPRFVLPYRNMRRNVKLFKLHGAILFPWARRLIWIDGKVTRALPLKLLLNFFRRAVESYRVCATFVAAPVNESVLGRRPSIISNQTNATAEFDFYANVTKATLQDHCRAVISEIARRPTVTDSIYAIEQQCQQYDLQDQKHTQSEHSAYKQTLPDARASPSPIPVPFHLDDGMIDSAFIAWDFRSERCRQFNADLGCTWSDEIHCHADRDQISFPYALQHIGLVQMSGRPISDTIHHTVVWHDQATQQPVIQIMQSECHWNNWRIAGPLDCPIRTSNTSSTSIAITSSTSRRIATHAVIRRRRRVRRSRRQWTMKWQINRRSFADR